MASGGDYQHYQQVVRRHLKGKGKSKGNDKGSSTDKSKGNDEVSLLFS